ncbi:MAG: ComF family protein [Jatrophihabitantaceae bacterium]
MSLSALATALTDLVLPRFCVGCNRPGPTLCRACTPPGLLRYDAAGLPVIAAGTYSGSLRTALIAYKERGRRDLAGPLGELLRRAVAAGPPSVLVPVPCAPAVARARGGDHVLRLARVAAGPGAYSVAMPLRLTRTVQDSAGLGAWERAANLRGAMTASAPSCPGVPALVIDDIVTTAATLHEAARALDAAGWLVRGSAVVAATARRAAGTSRSTGLT